MSNNAKNLPEVKLGQYKGLAVTRHVRPLSEKTIDQEMVHQTRMRSVYHNSTAPAKRGSRVLLDFYFSFQLPHGRFPFRITLPR